MVKGSKKEKNKREIFIQKSVFAKNSERGVKVGPASKMSPVSGKYHELEDKYGVNLASAKAEIHHVFGDSFPPSTSSSNMV